MNRVPLTRPSSGMRWQMGEGALGDLNAAGETRPAHNLGRYGFDEPSRPRAKPLNSLIDSKVVTFGRRARGAQSA